MERVTGKESGLGDTMKRNNGRVTDSDKCSDKCLQTQRKLHISCLFSIVQISRASPTEVIARAESLDQLMSALED
jgi:hypothetical protein